MHAITARGAIFGGSGNPERIRFRLYPFKIIFLAPSRPQKCKKKKLDFFEPTR